MSLMLKHRLGPENKADRLILPGVDGIDLDVVRTKLIGERVCQLAYGSLHRPIDGEGRLRPVRRKGADIYDFASLLTLDHMPGDALGQNPDGVEVDLYDLIKVSVHDQTKECVVSCRGHLLHLCARPSHAESGSSHCLSLPRCTRCPRCARRLAPFVQCFG